MFDLRRHGEHELLFLCAYDFAGLTQVDECYLDGTQMYLKRCCGVVAIKSYVVSFEVWKDVRTLRFGYVGGRCFSS